MKKRLKNLINQGVIYYGAGGALGFDTIATEVVLMLREKYPQIKLILVLPCKGQICSWTKEQAEKYKEIYKKADKVVCLSEYFYTGCMHACNRHLVDYSGYCICYLRKDNGGTSYTVNYAIMNGLKIIKIA